MAICLVYYPFKSFLAYLLYSSTSVGTKSMVTNPIPTAINIYPSILAILFSIFLSFTIFSIREQGITNRYLVSKRRDIIAIEAITAGVIVSFLLSI